eukprot:3016474-Rhodomonas_salina.1
MMSWRKPFDDVLSWSCKFCRVGPANSTHRCGVTVSPKEMVIKWWTGPSLPSPPLFLLSSPLRLFASATSVDFRSFITIPL